MPAGNVDREFIVFLQMMNQGKKNFLPGGEREGEMVTTETILHRERF